MNHNEYISQFYYIPQSTFWRLGFWYLFVLGRGYRYWVKWPPEQI